MILKENDRVQLKHIETGKLTTITVRWNDSRSGLMSKPDFNIYTIEGNEKWNPVSYKVIKKLPRISKKRTTKKS